MRLIVARDQLTYKMDQTITEGKVTNNCSLLGASTKTWLDQEVEGGFKRSFPHNNSSFTYINGQCIEQQVIKTQPFNLKNKCKEIVTKILTIDLESVTITTESGANIHVPYLASIYNGSQSMSNYLDSIVKAGPELDRKSCQDYSIFS